MLKMELINLIFVSIIEYDQQIDFISSCCRWLAVSGLEWCGGYIN